MKGVTSDVAARALVISCRNQFPKEPERESNSTTALPTPQREEFGARLRVDLSDSHAIVAIRRIQFVDFPDVYPNNNQFAAKKAPRFMNRNSFAIGGVLVGTIGKGQGKACPHKLDEYELILECQVPNEFGLGGGSIAANSSGLADCDKWDGPFCVVGFWTAENFEYKDEAESFIQRQLR